MKSNNQRHSDKFGCTRFVTMLAEVPVHYKCAQVKHKCHMYSYLCCSSTCAMNVLKVYVNACECMHIS